MTKPEKVVQIGSFGFDLESEALTSDDGTIVSLRPQTARVLGMLAAHSGELVTKDALMNAVWTDTHVTDDSLVQCISEIRKALGSEDGNLLKTVPRQGYRLDVAGQATTGSARRRMRVSVLLVAALAIVAAFLAAFLNLSRPAATRGLHSVAVLPFENASSDEGQAYYASGLSDELIVKLSQISDLRTVSRSASFSVAGQNRDPRWIAKELEVTHLIEGSVRRVGKDLRITAALINGESGENLWADSYTGNEEDVFEFQDSVVQEIVRVLSVRLSPQERARLGVRGTTNIDAFDHYLRGVELADFLNGADSRRAEAEFTEALRLDPDYAAAHAQLSLVLSMRAEFGWTDEPTATVSRATQHADLAVNLDPELPFAHFARGRLLSRSFVGDFGGAIAAFERAIELDPNYTDAHSFVALVQIFSGEAETGLVTANAALELNPRPPYWYFMPIGLAQFQLGDYEAAEAALTELLNRNPNFPPAMRTLIATYGKMGRVDDAQWIAMEYETLGSPATITNMLSTMNTAHPTYREAIAEGLRMAGLPE